MASGVPCVVTDSGGPSFVVESGETGFVCSDTEDFTAAIHRLMRDGRLLRQMRERARAAAYRASWDKVFDALYETYAEAMSTGSSRTTVALREQSEMLPAG